MNETIAIEVKYKKQQNGDFMLFVCYFCYFVESGDKP
jgi:hypothetical protein